MPRKATSRQKKPAKKPTRAEKKPELTESRNADASQELSPQDAEFFDRMMRRGGVHCPECDHYPAAVLQNYPNFKAYRCRNRNCRHVWEERT